MKLFFIFAISCVIVSGIGLTIVVVSLVIKVIKSVLNNISKM